MKLSRPHSSKSKRSLPHLKSLHITTPTVKQSLLQIHHQQGWEQFFFKHKIMDSAVPSVTSPDPSVMLKGTMQTSRKKRLPQPGHANALKEYVLGLRFTLETDRKPLVPLLTTTDLSKMPPPRCPRCLLHSRPTSCHCSAPPRNHRSSEKR